LQLEERVSLPAQLGRAMLEFRLRMPIKTRPDSTEERITDRLM
jgi:hypothetical protein